MHKRWKVMAIALIVLVATLVGTQSLAYYTAHGIATNVVTSGDIALTIHEKTADGADFPAEGVNVIPGDVVDKIVTVENSCAHPFYLRVKLVNSSSSDSLLPQDCLQVDLNTAAWTLREDGYIYYNRVLQAGETTEPVFTQVTVSGQALTREDIGTTLGLTVKAYAVQSAHNTAANPWEASGWPQE